MITPILLLIFGLIILIGGAEYLIRGASSIAKKIGVSTLAIGLTIVAFGTSAPELMVNILSSARGATDLAVANVIGSNLANILLVLGTGATIMALVVKKGTTYKEIPFALLAIVLVAIMGNDIFFDGAKTNMLSRTDGILLIALFIIFLYYTYGISKVSGESQKIKAYPWPIAGGMFILGIVGLTLGGKFIVDGATELANLAHLSEGLIGLTIVAVGTSLPELATTIVAVRKKHTDLAVGNAIGSNIFNVFLVLGISSTIRPLPFDMSINTDVLFTTAATLLLFVFMFVHEKHKLQRWQGIMFLIIYISYITFAIVR